MKIGIFDPYLDTLGGGEKYILTAASCLSNTNEVDLFWDEGNDLIKRAQERFEVDLSKVKLAKNIFAKDFPLLSRLVTSRKFDLIIFLSDGSIPLTLTRKLVLHFQFPVEWVDGSSLITKIKIALVDKIICNSKFTKNFIDKTFGVKSSVLYPPANINIKNQSFDKLRTKIKNKENLILTIGRFGRLSEGNNFKKQDVMIKTFKEMIDRGLTGWKFVVVITYRGQDEREIRKLEASIRAYPIQIFKNLTMKELSSLYNKAKIYWHAAGFGEDLKKHPERAEHFGMVTVEAMARGAVPVVFNAGGQTEIVEDNKNGFLWNTTEELIKKTNVLMQNGKLWGNMSDEAIKRAKMFGGRERFCRELKAIMSQGDSFAKESPLQKG